MQCHILHSPVVGSGNTDNGLADGDVYPLTLGGRIFTFIIALNRIGRGCRLHAGLIASALSKVREAESLINIEF